MTPFLDLWNVTVDDIGRFGSDMASLGVMPEY